MSEKTSELSTLQYYENNAQAFADGTISADMAEARQLFLRAIPEHGHILDFGCGSGRDTRAFLELGYRVDACDGSSELCRIAGEVAGIRVKQMLFQELGDVEEYDGIWACASILHLPKDELKAVLERIAVALKENGVLYTSFKYGTFEACIPGTHNYVFQPTV